MYSSALLKSWQNTRIRKFRLSSSRSAQAPATAAPSPASARSRFGSGSEPGCVGKMQIRGLCACVRRCCRRPLRIALIKQRGRPRGAPHELQSRAGSDFRLRCWQLRFRRADRMRDEPAAVPLGGLWILHRLLAGIRPQEAPARSQVQSRLQRAQQRPGGRHPRHSGPDLRGLNMQEHLAPGPRCQREGLRPKQEHVGHRGGGRGQQPQFRPARA